MFGKEKRNTPMDLSSHHTVKAVQLIYRLMKGQVQYERCKNCQEGVLFCFSQ